MLSVAGRCVLREIVAFPDPRAVSRISAETAKPLGVAGTGPEFQGHHLDASPEKGQSFINNRLESWSDIPADTRLTEPSVGYWTLALLSDTKEQPLRA